LRRRSVGHIRSGLRHEAADYLSVCSRISGSSRVRFRPDAALHREGLGICRFLVLPTPLCDLPSLGARERFCLLVCINTVLECCPVWMHSLSLARNEKRNFKLRDYRNSTTVSPQPVWPGSGDVKDAAFYSYSAPEPSGFKGCRKTVVEFLNTVILSLFWRRISRDISDLIAADVALSRKFRFSCQNATQL
jgi:hypothetical protein